MASTIDTSGIDATKPTAGAPTTASVRDNFAAIVAELGHAADDIEALQAGKQPLDATLTALSGVTTAADKLVYATGSDAFGTTDLTSFARSLLAGASAAAMRTTLGALATNGDGSAVTVTATDADTARTLADKAADIYHARDFGILPGNSTAAAKLNAAIAAVGARGGGIIHFDPAEYWIDQTVTHGNGTASGFSTINAVHLVGVGAPHLRLDDSSTPMRAVGTRFKWTGSSAGTMVTIAGPCYGNGLSNIALNCADSAANGLQLISASRGEFRNVTISDFTGTGLNLDVVDAESVAGQTEGISTEGNIFEGLRISAFDGGSNTIGINLDGYTGSAANGWDPVRNHFTDTYITVNLAGGTGIRLAYTDQNTFDGVYMSGFGTPDGNAASIRFVGTATVPGSHAFPQNNVFIGHIDTGQSLPVIRSGTIGAGNKIDNMTTFDQQVVPRWPENKEIRTQHVEAGTFPKGGYWADGGLHIHERSLRNRLLNPTFSRATRGTSFLGRTSGGYTLDQWRLVADGTFNIDVTRESFTLGQTDVPYEPKYFLRITVNSASGGTYFYVGQRVGGAHTLEGRRTCLSAWMRVSSGSISVNGRLEQNFGTGGSPSSTVGTNGSAVTVTTEWKRHAFPITLPSVTGKTLGSNGNDFVFAMLSLPVNTTFTIDIALPQWEAGPVDTAFDLRPTDLDELLCARYLRMIGAGAVGTFFSTTDATLTQPLSPPMRAAPTLSTDGSTVTISSPGTGTYTATATASGAATTAHSAKWNQTGMTGATATRIAMCETNAIYASAEL